MKLTVPEILKVKLVDDWEAVTKNNQVCPFVFLFLQLIHRSSGVCADCHILYVVGPSTADTDRGGYFTRVRGPRKVAG